MEQDTLRRLLAEPPAPPLRVGWLVLPTMSYASLLERERAPRTLSSSTE
jgi:hypothetical protein